MTFTASDFRGFVVTGRQVNGRRVKLTYPATYAGAITALSINLWRGNVWGFKPAGGRVRLKSVDN